MRSESRACTTPTVYLSNSALVAMDLTTAAGLETYLANTEYAAAEVQTLSGGYSGFTYRVTLKTPLPTGETSVVIKHALGYASSDVQMGYGVERMVRAFNQIISTRAQRFGGVLRTLSTLKMVGSSPLFTSTSTVQVPRVLSYDSDTHTLIMNDLSPARLLSAVLIECLESGDEALTRRVSSQIGAALGDFMGRFHLWTSLPEQRVLRERFLENKASSEECLEMQYELMLSTAARLGLRRAWMDEIVVKGLRDAREGGSVIAMADFWFSK